MRPPMPVTYDVAERRLYDAIKRARRAKWDIQGWDSVLCGLTQRANKIILKLALMAVAIEDDVQRSLIQEVYDMCSR